MTEILSKIHLEKENIGENVCVVKCPKSHFFWTKQICSADMQHRTSVVWTQLNVKQIARVISNSE